MIRRLLIAGTIPIFASIIQLIDPSATILWASMGMSTIIIYIYVEIDFMLRDPLTGMVTRGEFEKRVQIGLNRKEAFTLMFADMNDFKQINDTYGHTEGDSALKTMVNIFESNIRSNDTLCRYGGDEFALLIESNEENKSQELITRFQESIDDFNQNSEKSYRISVSIGSIFVCENSKMTLKKILEDADKLMYESKRKYKEEQTQL